MDIPPARREDSLKQYAPAERISVFAQMIELVMLAQMLRNAGQLQEVMRKCLKIALPADLHATAEDMLQKVQRMDKGRISRAHLTLDVGFMLHQRVRNHFLKRQVRYLMWDSSPQFGRDYQMRMVQLISSEKLPCMLEAFASIFQVWCSGSDDDTEPDFEDGLALEQESRHMEVIRKNLGAHALPTVLIGFGAATFAHKLWALLHSALLEVFTNAGLQEWCSSLLTVASDYGVERRLVEVDKAMMNAVMPCFTWYCQGAQSPIKCCKCCCRPSGHPALSEAHKHRRRNKMCFQKLVSSFLELVLSHQEALTEAWTSNFFCSKLRETIVVALVKF